MSDAVAAEAREIAMSTLISQMNMLAAGLSMAREADFPVDVVREFLNRLDASNEAMIPDSLSKQLIAQQLATMQEMWGTNGN